MMLDATASTSKNFRTHGADFSFLLFGGSSSCQKIGKNVTLEFAKKKVVLLKTDISNMFLGRCLFF